MRDYSTIPIQSLEDVLRDLVPRAECTRPMPTGIGCQRSRHYCGRATTDDGWDPEAAYVLALPIDRRRAR